MTNALADIAASIQPQPSAFPCQGADFSGHVPWVWFLLLFLWLITVMVTLSGITIGIGRKRKRLSTESISRRCLAVSVLVLFVGTGISAWKLAEDLISVVAISTSSRDMIQFAFFGICNNLYCFAINAVLAGVGLVVGMVLRDRKQGNPNPTSEGIRQPADGSTKPSM